MPKCSLRQLLSRAMSRRNGPASVQLPFFGGNGTRLGGGSVLPWGFGQRQDAGFLPLLYAYLFPDFLSLHYTLSFPLYISVKTLPEVFYSTTRCLQRKPGPFYCKMSRFESLPSAVQHEERMLNKEKKLKPTHSKASEDGQEVPRGG